MAYASAAVRSDVDAGDAGGGDFANQRPVDLVHLARHTLGNRELEREILQIFARQSVLYLERLQGAEDEAERRDAAHTIKGSARGIGAWEIAEYAALLEGPSPAGNALEAMAGAIERANRFIEVLLEDEQ